jgi:hypothetical protein
LNEIIMNIEAVRAIDNCSRLPRHEAKVLKENGFS